MANRGDKRSTQVIRSVSFLSGIQNPRSWVRQLKYPVKQCKTQNLMVDHHLVGGWATPLKNMKVNWDDDYSQYMGK